MKRVFLCFLGGLFMVTSCKQSSKSVTVYEPSIPDVKEKVEEFIPIELKTDLSKLSENERSMLPILFEAGKIMDDLFWKQAYGDKDALLGKIEDEYLKKFVKINYGPWERLNNNTSFIKGIGAKPLGANFYPQDITKDEFESIQDSDKTSLYTLIKRDETTRELSVIPYHVAYKEELTKVSDLLKKAAALADDEGLKDYLLKRSEALLTGEYFESDLAWMSMKNNTIDFVVGPIENYEDALYGAKAAFEAFILIKDKEWSGKLAYYATLLPQLQESLPVDKEYKSEVPGSDSDLGAYDVVFYGGDCNAGSKTIAINLPNDPKVHIEKGSRKLQLKNSMKAKFDKILVPISQLLIDDEQQANVSFDAFFENTMFHEVAHGLGIKNTLNGKGTVREALKETASAMEEGKADILGLYMVDMLTNMNELGDDQVLMDNYVTFMAGLFRSIRFGASSSHGKANMIRFNYFNEKGAFTKNEETGKYRVDFDKMHQAMIDLSKDILVMQGNGDYEKAQEWIKEKGFITPELQKDLDRIAEAGIPRDIVFQQGVDVLGL
ncbi:dipeptidyl-peptidase 3 family protein [Plebeiibacterium sediminum]|uniref:Zn-dependent hydrolase n=1 Tax=Plebeiibacterium sediminum TaxID=2992112 RepID=A0AAE3SHC0_9BACT|nr:Zn-dependent hydrolase [Plebeiobacterium sediminum]MCW3789062.1 Zn-dependent hydrolase [Plebeiobacterium sediminum]